MVERDESVFAVVMKLHGGGLHPNGTAPRISLPCPPLSLRTGVGSAGALLYIASEDRTQNENWLGPAPLEDLVAQVCTDVQALDS